MARALDEVLQKQVEGALLGFAQHDLRAVKLQPLGFADVVIGAVWPAIQHLCRLICFFLP